MLIRSIIVCDLDQRYFERLMQQDDDERAFIRYFQARDASNSTTVATTVATTVNTTASSTVANTTTNITATTIATNTTSNTCKLNILYAILLFINIMLFVAIVITLQNRAAMDARLQVLYTNANCEPFLAQSSTLLTSETTSVTLPTGSLNVKVIVQKDLIASNWRDAYTTKLNTTTLCLRITGVTVASNVEACPT